MGAEVVQGKYDELTEIASRFNEQADRTTQMEQRLRSAYEALQNNGWVGRGAQAFFAEMTSEMFPAVDRMHAALMAGSDVTRQLSELLKAAEEEAARVYTSNGGDFAMAAGSMAGGAGGGAAPPPNPFSTENMDKLVGSKFKGQGSKALNSAMEDLQTAKDPAKISKLLDTIAKERGLSREAVQADYEKFVELRQTAADNDVKAKPIMELLHRNYLGSETSLRYGSVVGQALDIDPVFGSLLNPSGGLVGPGNGAVDLDSSPLGYHGVVHDAAGYLYNGHNTGPGYDYLGRESGRDTSSPLTGQQAGINYWHAKLGSGSLLDAPVRNLQQDGGWLIGKLSTAKTKVFGSNEPAAGGSW